MTRWLMTLLLILSLLPMQAVQAQSTPSCVFNVDGSITCTTGGGGGGGNGTNGNGNSGGAACTPGQHQVMQVDSYNPASKTCTAYPMTVDNCSGQILLSVPEAMVVIPCQPQTSAPRHPCDMFTIDANGITCGNLEWKIQARVAFPPIYLDVRPYPVTLVRWPTALRNGGLPASSGSGGVNYIAHGGGTRNEPREGDWSNLRLILTLRPAGLMSVTLPKIGTLDLPNVGSTGNPTMIQWEVPSHPEVGGGPRAGSVSGMDELPADIPLFVGSGRAPYKLFWEIRYDEYEAEKECQPGTNENGRYNCGGGTGHNVIIGYEWNSHSRRGEIPPLAVTNLPVARMADLNKDGVPDSYWNNNLTLRRMDDNNRVNNPRYQRSWNWGGIIYWAVREGQGQIGWPGESVGP